MTKKIKTPRTRAKKLDFEDATTIRRKKDVNLDIKDKAAKVLEKTGRDQSKAEIIFPEE